MSTSRRTRRRNQSAARAHRAAGPRRDYPDPHKLAFRLDRAEDDEDGEDLYG